MHRVILELFAAARHLAPQSPASQPPARRVEDAEVVAIADARHFAEDGAVAEPGLVYPGGCGDAAEVGFPEGVQGEAGAGQDERGDVVLRVGPLGEREGGERGAGRYSRRT